MFVARGIAGYTPRWRGYFRDEPFADARQAVLFPPAF